MTSMNVLKKSILAACLTASMTMPGVVGAAAADASIDEQIQSQQQILQQLNDKKNKEQSERLSRQIADLEEQIRDLRKNGNQYDAEGAIDALADQIESLREQLNMQQSFQREMMEALKKLNDSHAERPAAPQAQYRGDSSSFLVNPGPSARVSYTQDAVNSQGNSTMTFAYAPNQLYKIYCRPGYLTDLAFKKGETIKFVGGGDTSSWAVNSTTVDGVPHIYIKPTVETSTTNLIVTTDKRSYQLILNTSDWYNPMVCWTYDADDRAMNLLQQKKDEKAITDTMNVRSYENLYFDYKVEGKSDYKPSMIFDDGEKTVIKFRKLSSKAPAFFVKERGKKGVSLVNYKVKDNCYILDRVISEGELRYSDQEVLHIKRL